MNKRTGIWIGLGLMLLLMYGLLDPDFFPFPQCPFLLLTGWECPGCGSQRAMHQLLHGQIATTFSLNLLFLPGLVYILVGYISMLFYPAFWGRIKEQWYDRNAAILILIIILVYWIGRNL